MHFWESSQYGNCLPLNMRAYILLIFFFGINSISKGQNNDTGPSHQLTVLYLPDYYKEKGVIFSKDYVIGIKMRKLKSRYTPTKDDIIKTEEILKGKYNEVRKANVNTKTFFCHWVRQYVGLIDTNGNRNVIVQLIDNTKPRKVKRILGKAWETSFVIYFADPYPGLGILFRINMDTGEMTDQL
jgi:hypothetical protein